MDFDDFLQDQPGDENNEQQEGFFEEMPEDLFSDLSIQVSFARKTLIFHKNNGFSLISH